MTDTDLQPPPTDLRAEERDGYTYNSYANFAAKGWGGETKAKGVGRWIGLVFLVGLLVLIGVLGGIAMVIVVLGLVLSIILHELGHFLVAKKSGMKVTEFFLGFGPRIWSFRRGETEYGVKVLPAGAYVRIIGMHNLEEVDPADEDRTYRSKTYGKRLATILAGPFMNIALGVIILAFVFALSGNYMDASDWKVKEAQAGSAAAMEPALLPGDKVLSIGGQEVTDFQQMREVLDQQAGQTAPVVIERDGKTITLTKPLGWRLNASGSRAIPGMLDRDVILDPTDDTKVRPGTYQDFVNELAQPGEHEFKFERQGYIFSNRVTGPITMPAQGAAGFFGVKGTTEKPTPLGFVDGTKAAVTSVGVITVKSGQNLARVFSPDGLSNYANTVAENVPGTASDSVKLIRAPEGAKAEDAPTTNTGGDRPSSVVGGVRAASDAAKASVALGFFVMAIINISLGLLNLLPLLPLDGGHAMVATYEAIRSRKGKQYRVDITKLLPLTYAFVAVLLVFGLTSIFLDFRAPVMP